VTSAASRTYAWYVVGVLTLANISGFIDRQILSLLVPSIKRDLGITDTQMSYLIGLSFAVFYTVLGLPIARWADRGNRRNIMAGGVAVWSVMTMLCGVARTYGRLLLTRIGVGVGEATLAAPSVSLIADYFPADRLGTAMSVYSLGVFLGSGLAYFIGGWTVGLVSAVDAWQWPIVGAIRPWQSVFFFVGAPGLLVALLMLTVREPRVAAGRDSRARAQPVSVAAFVAYVRENRRTFTTHSVGFALSATVNYGIAAWLATFLVRTYGWTVSRAGMVQGVLTMTVGVAGVLAGGYVADRFVRAGRVDGALRVGMIGAAGMLISATAYPLMPTPALAVAWLTVVNFFAAFPWGAASAAAAEMVPPPLRAQGAALYFLVMNLVSAILGPTSVALVTDYVFRDESALRYSLAVVNVLGMTSAIALFAAGLPAYRRTVVNRATWSADER
jgi:MFS family permease